MSNKILTISVAAYNLGNMIEKNITSFIKSKYKEDIEVIITDDGSTDNTAEIIEDYEKKYPSTIKLIKKKNEGAGSTVNSGIKHATGKYFKMVDGDDWVNTDNLDILIENLKKIDVDMVVTNYQIFNNETQEIIETKKINNFLPGEKIKFDEVANKISLVMHNIIFKTSVLKDNEIKLDNGFYTDMEYILLPIPKINTIIYYDLNLYVYMIAREGQSMSISSLQKHIDMHDLVLKRLVKHYEENKNSLTDNVRMFIKKKIAVMATNQLQTLLTFKDTNDKIKRIKDLNRYLKENSIEIYKIYKYNSKKAFLIINSNYILLSYISNKYINKITKEGQYV